MKLVFAARGLPICRLRGRAEARLAARPSAPSCTHVVGRLGFPLFVKPANLGSSVGISKARHATELRAAIDLAAEFDRKIVVEAAVPARAGDRVRRARQRRAGGVGAGRDRAVARVLRLRGEVPRRGLEDADSRRRSPTRRSSEVRTLAVAAFKAIDGAGMARVDFLLAGDSGELYVNEVNTIPGFTTISMYSKMWAASGLLDYPALLDRLIALALERHAEKQQLADGACDREQPTGSLGCLVPCWPACARSLARLAAPPRRDARRADRRRRASPRSTTPSSTPDSTQADADAEAGLSARARRSLPGAAASSSLWWQIQLDPDEPRARRARSTKRPPRPSRPARRGPAASRGAPRPGSTSPGRTRRSCSGGCLRGERLAAARDGNRIKEALERALALDPTLNDAYFGIGLYHYYADVAPARGEVPAVAPAAARRRSRAGAPRDAARRAISGELLSGEADYQLHLLVPLVRAAAARRRWSCSATSTRAIRTTRCSSQRIAEVEDEYFHDLPASAAAWQTPARPRAARHASTHAGSAEVARASRPGRSSSTRWTRRTAPSTSCSPCVDARRRQPPYGARARRAAARRGLRPSRPARPGGRARTGGASQRTGRRSARHLATRARAGLRQAPDAANRRTPIATSLEGWRALERGAIGTRATVCCARRRPARAGRSGRRAIGTRARSTHAAIDARAPRRARSA